MRSRNIKPGFFKNEDLADCVPLARILFAGLWCLADREGILEYRVRKIKVEVLPYDDCKIEKLIGQLVDKGFITLYSVNDKEYIYINTFKDHQNFNVKEKESTYPTPCLNGSQIVIDTKQERPLTEHPTLNTEHPTLKGGTKNDFDIFWKAYPNKIDKKYALKCWKKATDLPDIEIVIEAINKQKSWRYNANGAFRPAWKNPATWINKGSWNDVLDDNYGKLQEKTHGNSKGGSGIPKEYVSETIPISDAERAENLRRIRELTGTLGTDTA